MRLLTLRARWPRVLSRCLLLALLGTAAGCGGGPGRGKVSGRVLLDGEPLPGGTVTFRPVDGRADLVRAVLDETGTFSVELPEGEVFVSVDNRSLESKRGPMGPAKLPPKLQAIRDKLGKGGPPAPAPEAPPPPTGPGRYVKIPEKYYSPDSSELTFTVQRGDQPHDITLSSK